MEKPCMGFGTMLLKETCEVAVSDAVSMGYKLIDTGEHYGNLDLIGTGLNKASPGKAFVVTKLSGLPVGEYEAVKARVELMLNKLGMDKADLCLMHWPGLCTWDPTDMEPLESPESFNGKATSFEDFCNNIEAAWGNMLKLQAEGLITHIGTSNFYAHHMEELAKRCNGATPFANEIFIDTTNQETDFVSHQQSKGIKVIAYRPVRYPFPDGLLNVAKRQGVSPQTVVFAWLLSRGVFPLVKCRGAHIKDNIEAPMALMEKLTAADLDEIKNCDVGIRKGSEWFGKIWATHNETGISEDDVQQLVMFGVEEAKARECLEKTNGNMELAMDMAFS